MPFIKGTLSKFLTHGLQSVFMRFGDYMGGGVKPSGPSLDMPLTGEKLKNLILNLRVPIYIIALWHVRIIFSIFFFFHQFLSQHTVLLQASIGN